MEDMIVFASNLVAAADDTLAAARRHSALIATVESCTGGLVGAVLTSVPGSSDAVYGGFITYSNEAKARLGVPAPLIERHGAVSEEVARAMAEAGAAAVGGRTVAVAITGVAGPGGGSPDKPVGLVHFAAHFDGVTLHTRHEYGDIGRDDVRAVSAAEALSLTIRALDQRGSPAI